MQIKIKTNENDDDDEEDKLPKNERAAKKTAPLTNRIQISSASCEQRKKNRIYAVTTNIRRCHCIFTLFTVCQRK